MRVDDVAVPKAEIVAVPLDIGKDELVQVFREHGFSRVPVYKGTLDHPQGLVLLKDLALQHGFGATGRFSLKRLLRPILYAPPSMPTGVLLQKMQKERAHMALVIDEYGGVDGLVTIEDLIETVIGEIEDEHDEDEGALWKEEKPGVILAQSTAPLEEIEAALGIPLRAGEEDEEIDTLGGLVFLRSGRVPARGEVIGHESGVQFEIVDADPRRIKRLRVRAPAARARREAWMPWLTGWRRAVPWRLCAGCRWLRWGRRPGAFWPLATVAAHGRRWSALVARATTAALRLLESASGRRHRVFRAGAELDRRAIPDRHRAAWLDGPFRGGAALGSGLGLFWGAGGAFWPEQTRTPALGFRRQLHGAGMAARRDLDRLSLGDAGPCLDRHAP
jgi:magnesium and cobalt transporter